LNRCVQDDRPEQAAGSGSTNDAWLSQTAGGAEDNTANEP
jgi:hypothetical protein